MIRKTTVEAKQQSRWMRGIWVGKTTKSTEHLVMTSEGMVVSRTVRRFAEDSQFQRSIYDEARGLPWQPKPPTTTRADGDQAAVARTRCARFAGPTGWAGEVGSVIILFV